MTGAYLRVKRDGEYKPIEIEYLTDAERALKFHGKEADEVLPWLHLLCRKIAEIEPLLTELEKDGILERRGE